MAFLKKNPRCLIDDDLFLELVFEEGKSLEEDETLQELIEKIDNQLLQEERLPIEKTLPYLSFYQADLLFSALSQSLGYFEFKELKLSHKDIKGKGASSDGELKASPYVITSDYDNLLLPLIKAVVSAEEFKDISYEDKRDYFVVTVFPAYKASLALTEASMPLFPSQAEVEQFTAELSPSKRNSPAKHSKQPSLESEKILKTPLYWLVGLLTCLTLFSFVQASRLSSELQRSTEKLTYLNSRYQEVSKLQEKEHEIDAFSRYFLPNYYSGEKGRLKHFLDTGNAKYTIPKKGNVQSVILEKIELKGAHQYQVSYVLALKDEEGKSKQLRLQFKVKEVKKSKKRPLGFVLTSDPKEKEFTFTQ